MIERKSLLKESPSGRPAPGFTLIELLVVIAIIAILAAILFPVFAKARERAKVTTCTSNLKQVGIQFKMYADDNDQHMPFAQDPSDWNHFGTIPLVWSVMKPYGGTFEHWRCPSDHGYYKDVSGFPIDDKGTAGPTVKKGTPWYNYTKGGSYWYNSRIGCQKPGSKKGGPSIDSLGSVSSTNFVLAYDPGWWHNTDAFTYAATHVGATDERSKAQPYAIMMDGHVQRYATYAAFVTDYNNTDKVCGVY
jgi:prepilin-type N-terminal cleavage/methylation domain-containing protein